MEGTQTDQWYHLYIADIYLVLSSLDYYIGLCNICVSSQNGLLYLNNNFRLFFPGSIYTDRLDTATLLGLIGKHNTFTPVEDLKLRADFECVIGIIFKSQIGSVVADINNPLNYNSVHGPNSLIFKIYI